jgi:hypothetical protein
MTAINKEASATSMHVLNVGQERLVTVGGCMLLRFSH